MKVKNILKKTKAKSGITLIALVITIIVLLILAGVALNTLFGENGIINNAQEASIKTDIAETKEQIQIELAGKYNENGAYTNRDVIEAVKKVTGKEVEEKAETVLSQKGNEVEISDLWVEGISTKASYVGYYADVDGNGTVDGVIFADLAIGGSGQWGDSNGVYEYSVESEGLKNYTIGESYEGAFGTKEVIKATGTGKDRFYVMSLDNFITGSYKKFYWYYNASGKLDRKVSGKYNDFGQGKRNTIDMINDWNNNTEKYGEQTTSESGKTYIDMWGAIQDGQYKLVESEQDSKRWFIPSKSELAAFGDAFKIDNSNYEAYGLNNWYWSSSQSNDNSAYYTDFEIGSIRYLTVGSSIFVRLATTF